MTIKANYLLAPVRGIATAVAMDFLNIFANQIM